jgi:lysophospholipase L1-like esterase
VNILNLTDPNYGTILSVDLDNPSGIFHYTDPNTAEIVSIDLKNPTGTVYAMEHSTGNYIAIDVSNPTGILEVTDENTGETLVVDLSSSSGVYNTVDQNTGELVQINLENNILLFNKNSFLPVELRKNIITDGLVLCWKHDEGSGQRLTDTISGYIGQFGATSGTETSDPVWGNGFITYSSGDYIKSSDIPDSMFLGENGFTIILVQKIENTASEKFVQFVSKNTGASSSNIPIEWRTDSSIPSIVSFTKSNSTNSRLLKGGQYLLNEWAMYGYVTPQTMEANSYFYINSVRHGFSKDGASYHFSSNGVGIPTGANRNLRLGTREDGVVKLVGSTAYLLVYNRQLSVAEMEKNYKAIRTVMSTRGIELRDKDVLVGFHGDSLTWGTGSSTQSGPYPTQCMALLPNSYQYLNAGVPGEGLSNLDIEATTYLDPAISSIYNKRICVIWAGSNNIDGGSTAAAVQSMLLAYVSNRKLAGWDDIIVLTCLDRSAYSAAETIQRNSWNTLIRNDANTYGYTVADVAADSTIGPDGAWSNATYFSDGVHLTNAGYSIVANLVKTKIESLV